MRSQEQSPSDSRTHVFACKTHDSRLVSRPIALKQDNALLLSNVDMSHYTRLKIL
jgi:hypothetical protein